MKAMVTGAVAMAGVLAAAGPAVAADGRSGSRLPATGQFEPVAAGEEVPEAVTYDRELVPSGAVILVTVRVGGDRTTIRLAVAGLVPGRSYGAHVHTAPCGAAPTDAGPHYQNEPGAVTPENEVWLDFTADESGVGQAVARQDWVFREGGANSVVLHEHGTSRSGDAGGRAACLTVPFEGAAGS